MSKNKWINQRGRIYWYDQYALNEHEAAFSKYDPDRIADELVSIGSDLVALYASNQFSIAYYPSKIWPMHPNLKGRDYFGEVSQRLRARGIKVLAYVNWLDSLHPEWNAIPVGQEDNPRYKQQKLVRWADPNDPNKRAQDLPGGSWRSPCFNSPRREQVVAVAREICENYHPDAFHVDMLIEDICVCPYCRPTLERICGTEEITLDAIHAHWRDYIDFRHESCARIVREVTEVLREYGVVAAHNAMAPLYMLSHYGPGESWLEHIDIYLSECFDAFCVPGSDLNSTGINVRWQRAIGKPSWILRTSAQIHYSHWPISKAMWEVYSAASKANGCKFFGPCGVGAYPDTTSPKSLLANVKHGFDHYMRDADLDEDAAPISRIGLVFSWNTRKYSYDMRWQEELVGWARLLIEEHLPFEIISAERTTSAADLAGYDLVILPGVKCLSDTFCGAVRDYVRAGGLVIATADTSLADETGKPRDQFALGDLFGITRRDSVEGHFAIERPAEPEPATGVFQMVTTSGRTVARRVAVDPVGGVAAGADPLPMKPTEWPVVSTADFGAGRGMYIAFDIGRHYTTYGDQHIGVFMAELIDSILPERQIVVRGPRTVEVSLWEQKELGRTIIHLANRTVPWTLPTHAREFTEVIPVHDFAISMRAPCDSPRVSCRGAEVACRLDGDRLSITIDKLDAYAAVLIEPIGGVTQA